MTDYFSRTRDSFSEPASSGGPDRQHLRVVRRISGQIANTIDVPHERDFDIDLYCEPRFPAEHRTETEADIRQHRSQFPAAVNFAMIGSQVVK